MVIEELKNFLVITIFTSVMIGILYINTQHNIYKAKIPLIIYDYIKDTNNVSYIKRYNTNRKLFYNYEIYLKDSNSCNDFEDYIKQKFSGKLIINFTCSGGIVNINGKYKFLPFN